MNIVLIIVLVLLMKEKGKLSNESYSIMDDLWCSDEEYQKLKKKKGANKK